MNLKATADGAVKSTGDFIKFTGAPYLVIPRLSKRRENYRCLCTDQTSCHKFQIKAKRNQKQELEKKNFQEININFVRLNLIIKIAIDRKYLCSLSVYCLVQFHIQKS